MHSFLPLLLALVCLTSPLPGSNAASSGARTLLQQEAQGSTCQWQEAASYCVPSLEVSKDYVSETEDSSLKDIILESLECHSITSESECGDSEHCRWSEGLEWCTYKATRTDLEHFQRCIGPASMFAGARFLFKQCQESATNGVVCDIAPVCGWDDEKEACEFDAWKALTGIGSIGVTRRLPKGIDQVLEIRANQITDQLAAEGVTESSDILAWKPPPMKCPDGVDVALCILAEAADRAIITEVYCQSKSEDNSCSSDQLCDESCKAAENVVAVSERAMTNGYIMMVSDSTAALILRRHAECLQRPKSECPKDKDCVWDVDSDVCEAQPGYVMRTLAKFGLRNSFVDCESIKLVFSSGCAEHDADTCPAQGGCTWDEKDDYCVPSSGLFLQGYMEVIEADDDLKDRVASAVESCGEITQSENCV